MIKQQQRTPMGHRHSAILLVVLVLSMLRAFYPPSSVKDGEGWICVVESRTLAVHACGEI